LERSRKDEAGAGEEIALTQHDVGGEVVRCPALEQRGYVAAELFEEIAQCKALLRVKRKILHIPMVPTRFRPLSPFEWTRHQCCFKQLKEMIGLSVLIQDGGILIFVTVKMADPP
jgi:hypothetical protein